MQAISVEAAIDMIPHGASLMIGGFMGVGTPERLIDELVRQGKRDLIVIANDAATPGRGIGKLIAAGLVAKAVASHIGLNPEAQRQMLAGQIECRLGAAGDAHRANPGRRLRSGRGSHGNGSGHRRRRGKAAN